MLAVDLPDEALTVLEPVSAALNGKTGALLWAASAEDGRKLAEYRLDFQPVVDGLAVAGGRAFIAAESGHVVCMGRKLSATLQNAMTWTAHGPRLSGPACPDRDYRDRSANSALIPGSLRCTTRWSAASIFW